MEANFTEDDIQVDHNVTKTKSKARRIRTSNFLVLINPNKQDIDTKVLSNAVKGVISKIGTLEFIKITDSADKSNPEIWLGDRGNANNPEAFKSCNLRAARIENGGKLDRPHAHFAISIEHKTKIQLDLSKIRKYLDGTVGPCLLRAKFFKTDESSMAKVINYCNKDD